MGHRKGSPKTPGSGRKKGTPNKTTASCRQALQEAFEQKGGVAALVRWAKKNPTEFYKLWSKLLPLDVHLGGPDGGPLEHDHGNLNERLDALAGAFLGVARRSSPLSIPGNGLREPVDPGADQSRDNA